MTKDDSERRPLLVAKENSYIDEALVARDFYVTLACIFCVCGVIIGTYWYSLFFAAWESDKLLGWGPMDTMRLSTSSTVAQFTGAFVVGPLGDIFAPRKLLMLEAATCGAGLLFLVAVPTKIVIFVVVCSIGIMKGILWPATNALMSANLAQSKFDVAFMAAALGSRIGETLSATVVGVSLQVYGLSWQGTVLVLLGCIMVLLVCSALCKPSDLKDMEEASLASRASLADLGRKWYRLVTCFEGWLVITINLGSYALWALYDYVGVALVDLHHVSPGEAAAGNGWISLGSALGLIFGVTVSGSLGVLLGRTIHILQSLSAMGALAALCFMEVSLRTTYFLLMVMGFGFVVAAYLPCLLYGGTSDASERAFRVSGIDGLCSFVAIGFTLLYGTLRAQGTSGVRAIFGFASLCSLLATVSTGVFYWRMHHRNAGKQQLCEL